MASAVLALRTRAAGNERDAGTVVVGRGGEGGLGRLSGCRDSATVSSEYPGCGGRRSEANPRSESAIT